MFQDPYTSLNPSMTIESILTEPLTVRNVSAARTRPSACGTCSTRSPADRTPPTGCRGSSPAASASASPSPGRSPSTRNLIVCDEPVSALDLSTQARVLDLFREIQERTGVAYLFVSHDLAVVRHLSHRVAVMLHGEIVEWGDGDQVTARARAPLHAAAVPRRARARPRPARRGGGSTGKRLIEEQRAQHIEPDAA